MAIDSRDPRTLYEQLAGLLRTGIRSGRYRPGDKLPGIRELGELYDVSQNTAIAALRILQHEGLVEARGSRGTFVRALPAVLQMSESFVTHRPGAPLHTWQTALKEMGLHGQQKILSVGRARSPIEVTSRLGVEPGTEVVLRRRLMLVNGQPYQFADSYYPVEIAGGSVLEGLAKVTGGSAAALEMLGVPPERYVEEVSVRPPEEAERALLGIPASTWVMIQLRTAYAAGGRRVEVAHMVMAGDRHQLVYEVPAKRV